MIDLTQCLESCVSRFYFTYCMFYVWKRSIWIGVLQRAYTKTKATIWPTKYRAGAALVSTITKRLYSPLGGVILIYFVFLFFFSKREYLLTVAWISRSNLIFAKDSCWPNVNKCLNKNNWQVLWTYKCLVQIQSTIKQNVLIKGLFDKS